MLLPALNSARESGRRSNCLSNLKQLATYSVFYADENDGYFMPACLNINGTLYWFMENIKAYLPKSSWKRETNVLRCPSEKSPIDNLNNYFTYGVSDYFGLQTYDMTKRFLKTNMIKRASDTAYNSDAFPTSQYHMVAWRAWGYDDVTENTDEATNKSHLRIKWDLHQDSANLNFVDGHAQNYKRYAAKAKGDVFYDHAEH